MKVLRPIKSLTQQTSVVYANFVHHLAKTICLHLEQLILCDAFMVLTFSTVFVEHVYM